MKTLISIFHNPETDDTFAGIIQGDRCFCYSHIGQHSGISKSYLKDSYAAKITEETISLWYEIKEAYNDCIPILIDDVEFMNIVENKSIIFSL